MKKGIYNCQFVIAPIRSHEREENLRPRKQRVRLVFGEFHKAKDKQK